MCSVWKKFYQLEVKLALNGILAATLNGSNQLQLNSSIYVTCSVPLPSRCQHYQDKGNKTKSINGCFWTYSAFTASELEGDVVPQISKMTNPNQWRLQYRSTLHTQSH